MNKFKVGDKVRCVDDGGGYYLKENREYIISELVDFELVRVLGVEGRHWASRFEHAGLWSALDTKDTNPKDAMGTAKVPMLSVVPMRVLGDVAMALFEGARKYGRHNYRTAGVRASVYMDAVGRHLAAWYEGEDIDPDSGVSHVTKAIAALVVLRDSMMQGNWTDDRPPKCEPWVAEMNETAKKIIDKYPECVQAHTEKK